MTDKRRLESRKVAEVARQYEQRGYLVSVNPDHSEIPFFLEEYQPDIIARSEAETVIVEIRSKDSLSEIGRFAGIIEQIQNKPGWRFELVVTNPTHPEAGEDISLPQAYDRLRRAGALAEEPENVEAALLLSWSAVEAVLRSWLRKIERHPRPRFRSPGTLAKSAYSLGLVTREELSALETTISFRNRISHGFLGDGPSTAELKRFLQIAVRLIERATESGDL